MYVVYWYRVGGSSLLAKSKMQPLIQPMKFDPPSEHEHDIKLTLVEAVSLGVLIKQMNFGRIEKQVGY